MAVKASWQENLVFIPNLGRVVPRISHPAFFNPVNGGSMKTLQHITEYVSLEWEER